MATATNNDILSLIDSVLTRAKRAEDASVGKTTHPSDKVDNNTQAAAEGEHGHELTSLIKQDVPGENVDSAPEKSPTTGTMGEANGLQIGVKQTATGEDPSVEKGYEDGRHPDDSVGGKSESPARTDNPEVTPKFGNDLSSLRKAAEVISKLGNDLLADCVADAKTAAPKAAADAQPAVSPATAAAAGNELAGLVGTDKKAMDELVVESLAQTIFEAQRIGEKTAQYILGAMEAEKKAAAKATGKAADFGAADGGSGSGNDTGDDSGDDDSSPPAHDAAAGGPPPGADAGAGGPPPGAGGGGNADLDQLIQLLMQAGVTPEQLQQLLAGGGGADGGAAAGGPPMAPPGAGGPPPVMGAGGPPPMAPPGAGAGGPPPMDPTKMGSDKQAATQKYAEMHSYLRELIARGRK